MDPAKEAAVIVRYNDAEKPADRHPAVLERNVSDPKKTKGRVLLLTTRMDVPPAGEEWHNYWEIEGSTWFSVFPYLVVRYLAGDTADANFNYPAGAPSVTVPLPKGGVPKGTKVLIEGPDIFGNDMLIEVGDKQTELRVGPPRTNQPGNFKLSVGQWLDGFSLNVPAGPFVMGQPMRRGRGHRRHRLRR